jgi:L-amino acid N-acyltransferase YncA
MTIIPLSEEHYPAISAIYMEGIESGNATFETKSPDWEMWDKGHIAHSRIVAMVDGQVAGWAALSSVSGRCVYGGVAEVSVYIGKDFRGTGIGTALLFELINQSEQNGLWTLQSGIFPENTSSIKIHERCGFRRIGYRERVGQLAGRWRDTVQFERRSKIVGV